MDSTQSRIVEREVRLQAAEASRDLRRLREYVDQALSGLDANPDSQGAESIAGTLINAATALAQAQRAAGTLAGLLVVEEIVKS